QLKSHKRRMPITILLDQNMRPNGSKEVRGQNGIYPLYWTKSQGGIYAVFVSFQKSVLKCITMENGLRLQMRFSLQVFRIISEDGLQLQEARVLNH
uniref:hypothetical protein n=1 Tax=Aminicella lysinilytica TaxID=433323 RepID=UPI0026F01ECC